MYKTNTPNYVKNFNSFDSIDNNNELKNIKKNTKNDIETKQIPGNKKLFFNKKTKKMDDISPLEVNDLIEIKESIDLDVKSNILSSKLYEDFEYELYNLVSKFKKGIEKDISSQIGYDNNNTEHKMALKQIAIDSVSKFI